MACGAASAAMSLLASGVAIARECEKPSVLRFSLVPQRTVQKEVAELEPLIKNLQSALGVPVEVITPASYGGVVEGLIGGAVHVARLGPASYIAAKRQDGQVEAFASYFRKDNQYQDAGAFYHTLLVVREDSSFKTLDSLRGKRLALVDPGSTSGALVPRQVFPKSTGLPLDRHFGRIVYAGSHDLAARRVVEGQDDAAFVASVNLASYSADAQQPQAPFRILWRSSPIPLDPFVYRGQLCSEVKEKIRAVFLPQEGRQDRKVLENLNAIRFVPVGDKDYDIIRSMY